MTIISLSLSILKALNQVLANQDRIIQGQHSLCHQTAEIWVAVNDLAVTQEKLGIILDKIMGAVETAPVGVTARIVLGTPEQQ